MEIHEYMNLKGAFVFRLLEISGALTAEEIQDIRNATGSAKRTYPVKTPNLTMREFIISDVQDLVKSRLCKTTKEAEKLAIEIIQDAGNSVRKRMELAILVEESEEEKARVVGRIGVRRLWKGMVSADGEVMLQVEKLLNTLHEDEEMMILYIFLDPELADRGYMKEALDAFIPASAKIMSHGLTTDSEPASERGLKRIEGSAFKGGEIYQIIDTQH